MATPTSSQRVTSTQAILEAIPNPTRFAQLTGGQTTDQLVANIVAAMGTQFDPILTTALGVLEAEAQTAVTELQSQLAAAQTAVTAYTVT